MSINEEFTISYWVNKSDEMLSEAEYIADLTGEGFSHGDYGHGGYYTPDASLFLTKEKALALLESGKELSELEKYLIPLAIEKGLVDEDSEGWDSSTGWMSSSDQC